MTTYRVLYISKAPEELGERWVRDTRAFPKLIEYLDGERDEGDVLILNEETGAVYRAEDFFFEDDVLDMRRFQTIDEEE